MKESMHLKTIDSFKLSAVHTKAKGDDVVLWLHGITEDKDEYLNFFKDGADFLKNEGIDSFRFDFRGHGKSSGNSLDFSVIGQVIDAETAVNYLIEHYHQKIKIHIVAASFGAPPALFVASFYPEIIKSVLLVAPVLSYERTFLKPETEWAKSIFNQKTISNLAKIKKLHINDKFPISIRLFEEMKVIKPDLIINEVEQKIMVIHGDSDSMVPYQVSLDLAKKNRNMELITISQMDHGFMDVNDEEGTSASSINNKERIFKTILKSVTYE